MRTTLVTPAAHAQARRTAAAITVAAAADPAVTSVTVIDGDHQALGRNAWAPWALSAAAHRPYTEQEAPGFHTVQWALRLKLPRLREEVDQIGAEAESLMPSRWRARQVQYQARPRRLPVPIAGPSSTGTLQRR